MDDGRQPAGADARDEESVEALKALFRETEEAYRRHDAEPGGADDGLLVVSAQDAEDMLAGPKTAKAHTAASRHRRLVAQWVWDHRGEVAGEPGDWHGLVNQFFDGDDWASALMVAKAGLERFPSDATLLGDALRCALNLGDWEEGDAFLERAEKADGRCEEDWYLPYFATRYLRAKAHAQGAEERKATYGKALALVRDAQRRIPPTDRLVNCEAEILIESGNVKGAREVLEKAIFMDDYVGVAPNPKRRPVPQCCVTYLQELLSESCDYDTIIRVCDAGIRFAAVELRAVKVGYFVYRKALAMDAQMLMNVGGPNSQGFGNQDYVRQVLRTYGLAYQLHPSTTYRGICRQRFQILCNLADIRDMDVDEYCPEVG